MTSPSYSLMTAAYNEGRFLPDTIACVLAQDRRPERWIIVSDASTDDTDRIAAEAAETHDFIHFLRFENQEKCPYVMGGTTWKKVSALRAGLAKYGPLTSDYVCNLDADVTFEPDLFTQLIARMEAKPDLGLTSGYIWNISDGVTSPYFATNPDVAGGPLQFFRRSVYEEIGGYVAFGQTDTIAQIMVRMHGHRVRSFPEFRILHHKTAKEKVGGSRLKGQFHAGKQERAMGFHPLHTMAKCARRLHRRPLGSMAWMWGYTWAAAKGIRSELPPEVVAFNQREQLANLRQRLRGG
jgi:poly-beta-1,6-N-acetyl-D-glucosamine synthase